MLREKLGVEIVPVAGCLIESDVRAEAEAYNSVVEAEIARRFGEHAIRDVAREAERQYANEEAAVLTPPRGSVRD